MNIKQLEVGPLQTNCYLVWADGRDDCVVVDPGAEPDRIRLAAAGLGKKIAAILLTHGHFDHVTGVRPLADSTGCAVYLCGEDLSLPPRLTGGTHYYTHTYQDGDVLTLAGITFSVMQTPGHTKGSVCLLAEDHMFSGDTLFAGACGRTDLPGGSWAEISASLKRLASLPKDYAVHPGHGCGTTLDTERRENPYMG